MGHIFFLMPISPLLMNGFSKSQCLGSNNKAIRPISKKPIFVYCDNHMAQKQPKSVNFCQNCTLQNCLCIHNMPWGPLRIMPSLVLISKTVAHVPTMELGDIPFICWSVMWFPAQYRILTAP